MQDADGWERSLGFITAPVLSAIVPVYGAERFMRGLLEDLEAQTLADRMEILVVDTGSPTGEGAIVRELQARYPNIAYLRTETRETNCAAQNRAIEAARGRYLTLAMADDRHRPDALARLVAALEARPDVGLVYADSAVTVRENETFATADVVAHFRWPDFDPRLLFACCYVGPQPVYRRELHGRFGLLDVDYAGACDYEMWLRLVAGGVRFHHVPEVLGLYFLNPHGAEHGNRATTDRDSERARSAHWPTAWGACPTPGRSFLVPVSSEGLRRMQGGKAPTPRASAPTPSALPAPSAASHGPEASPPLVSVVMPTRDRPTWLARAVGSVLAQTHRAVELLVVNDGGADVGALLASLDPDGRVVSVRLPRSRERSAARNAGLALARGRYVAYLDDDDWWEPTHLAALVAALETSDAGVAYGDARLVREERRGDDYVATGTADVPGQPFDLARLLVGNYIPILSVLHRRNCLAPGEGFDESLATHEDWDLWIRLALRTPFQHVPGVRANISWREDGSSTTSARRPDFVRTCAVVHARYADAAHALPGVAAAQARYLAGMRARCPEAAGDAAPNPTRGADGAATPTEAPPPAGLVDCTVVLPVADDLERLRQCVTRLARVSEGVAWELVIVDDASDVATRAFLGTIRGDVRILRNERPRGFATACNQGAAAARGRYLVFLAAATVPREGWLAALVAEAEAQPDVHVVGSLLADPDGTVRHAGMALPLGGRPVVVGEGQSAATPALMERREVDAVTVEGMLVRRDAFVATGGFDAKFAGTFEDVDLCRRIAARGGRIVYQPASALYCLADVVGVEAVVAAVRERLATEGAPHTTGGADAAWMAEGEDAMIYLEEAAAAAPAAATEFPGLAAVQQRARTEGVEAIRPWLAIPEAWPDDASALRFGARVATNADMPREAVAFWRRVLALEDAPDARAALARDALVQGDLGGARELLDHLLTAAPEHGEGWLMQGVLALQREDWTAAVEAFEAAARRGADPRKTRLGLGMAILGQGQAAAAWELFADLLLEHPDDAEIVHWLLRAGCVLERWHDLEAPLGRYLARHPEDAAVRFALAGVQVRDGRPEAARLEYEALRTAAPELAGLADLGRAIADAERGRGDAGAWTRAARAAGGR